MTRRTKRYGRKFPTEAEHKSHSHCGIKATKASVLVTLRSLSLRRGVENKIAARENTAVLHRIMEFWRWDCPSYTGLYWRHLKQGALLACRDRYLHQFRACGIWNHFWRIFLCRLWLVDYAYATASRKSRPIGLWDNSLDHIADTDVRTERSELSNATEPRGCITIFSSIQGYTLDVSFFVSAWFHPAASPMLTVM